MVVSTTKVATLAGSLAFLLLGCQAPDTPVSGEPFSPVAFRCPPSGTTAVAANGSTTVYAGTDPNDPNVCLVHAANGGVVRRLYNFYALPIGDEDAFRRGLQGLWPLELGKEVNFSVITRAARSQETYQYRYRIRVLRRETIAVGGVNRHAIVVEILEEGVNQNRFSGTFTRWIDVETGAILRRVVRVIRGNFAGPNYEAVRITTP